VEWENPENDYLIAAFFTERGPVDMSLDGATCTRYQILVSLVRNLIKRFIYAFRRTSLTLSERNRTQSHTSAIITTLRDVV
jgi:hypothetical protein